MRLSKLTACVCIISVTYAFFTGNVYAGASYRVQVDERGNYVAEGGINSYDGTEAKSYDETLQLEHLLKSEGYILVSSENKEISDEEFDIFFESDYRFWFSEYVRPDEIYYHTKYRVYLYEPSYNDFMEQLENNQYVEGYTQTELEASSVVISYAYWDSIAKSGTVSDEWGDNIPEWYKATGYLEISSPIDTEITLRLDQENTYYVFNVLKNTPYLVRMKAGGYQVTGINTIQFENGAGTTDYLPYNNLLQITAENTEENPYRISLGKLVDAYDVSDKSSGDMEETQIIHIEQTTVPTEQDEETNHRKIKIHAAVITLLITAALCGLLLYLLYYKKKAREYDNEDDWK